MEALIFIRLRNLKGLTFRARTFCKWRLQLTKASESLIKMQFQQHRAKLVICNSYKPPHLIEVVIKELRQVETSLLSKAIIKAKVISHHPEEIIMETL